MDRTQAIILKKIPVGEIDEFLVCYSKDFGKIRLLAKGIHQKDSKQRNHLDVLDLADFLIVRGRNFDTLRSALSLSKFSKIKSDLKLSALAFGAVELIDKTILENQPDINIWRLLGNYLNYLNNRGQMSGSTRGKNNIGPIPSPSASYGAGPGTSNILSLFHTFFINFVRFQGHNENGFNSNNKFTVASYLASVQNFIYSEFQKNLNSLQFLEEVVE